MSMPLAGMLAPCSQVILKRSLSKEQQSPSLRSSPESQYPREREQGGGDSPRDRWGAGASRAATGVEYASASEEYSGNHTSLSPPLTTAARTTSPQIFRQHGIESTPGPVSSRKRKASTPTPTPTPTTKKQKRAPRPQYTKEQEDFIWFCRDDLAMSWRKVVKLYNDFWHPFESEPHIRSESGLQSRYYRILDFPVKVRKKKEPSRPDLGLIPSTNRRYHWMGVLTDQGDIESYIGGEEIVLEIDVGYASGGGGGGGGRGVKSSSVNRMQSSGRNQQNSDGCEPASTISPPSSPNSTPRQHQSACTYPRRQVDRQTHASRGHHRAKSYPPPRCSWDNAHPPWRQIGRGGGEGEAEREREGRPESRRVVDPRLSVPSLCV